MIAKPASFLALCLTATQAQAGSCAQLDEFVRSGQLPAVGGSEAKCSISRVLGGGRSEDCFWQFELRSSEALSHFNALQSELRACAEAEVTKSASSVNHPDSYDQITGVVQGVALSLSLKDKGGLNRTLVVLRRDLP